MGKRLLKVCLSTTSLSNDGDHVALFPPTFVRESSCQKSLKFTTLVHGMVTRYGPQLKPFLPVLRASIGRCSTFMVKAVIAALQRLDK